MLLTRYLTVQLSPPPLQARVEAAGGQILFWNGVRVMGLLAVSRAIGDHSLRPYVISQPEVSAPEAHGGVAGGVEVSLEVSFLWGRGGQGRPMGISVGGEETGS